MMHRFLLPMLTILVGCGNGSTPESGDEAAVVTAAPAVTVEAGEPGRSVKPQGPVQIAYKIIGTPVVGQPVGIDLQVSSNVGKQALTLTYRINDPTAMQFPEAQPSSVALAPRRDEAPSVQQVRVIPLREGRLYLNVSVHIETATGTLATATAIPIQVGAPPNREPASNGVTTTDENGAAIRVLQGN